MIEILLLLATICVAVAGAFAFALFRVSRQQLKEPVNRNTVNMAIADDNREMLSSTLEADEVEEVDVEIDVALLNDVAQESGRQVETTNRWSLLLMSILIPLVAISLYWFVWGKPGTVLLEEASSYLQSEISEANSRRVVERIREYVSIHPENQRAWVSLMSFQWLLGEREEFRKTHKEAELAGHTSSFTDSLYLLDAFRRRQLDLSPYDRLVRDRLRNADQASQVLALFDAIEHTSRGDFRAANRAWEDVLSQRDVFELHEMANIGQRATWVRLAAESHPKIEVSVSLEEPFPDKTWLFVYARSDSNLPPLAVVKRPITGQRRFQLTLDDSVAMSPGSLLSEANEVFVTARLSASGDALVQSGDIHVTSKSVNAIHRPKVELPFGTTTPIVTVKIQSENEVTPLETVFIIVRKRAVSGPPIAVRRVFGPLSSQAIELTLADVMIPTVSASALDDLVVSARLSRSSSTNARPGDVESESLEFERGAMVELKLDRIVGDEPRN